PIGFSRSRTSLRVPVRSLALGVLLVVGVFLPELFLELRVGLLLRRLSQAAGDDVVVAPLRGLARHRAVAGAVVGHLAGLVGLEVAGVVAAPGVVVAVGGERLVRRRAGGRRLVIRCALGGGIAGRGAAPRVALARDLLLLLAQLRIEG